MNTKIIQAPQRAQIINNNLTIAKCLTDIYNELIYPLETIISTCTSHNFDPYSEYHLRAEKIMIIADTIRAELVHKIKSRQYKESTDMLSIINYTHIQSIEALIKKIGEKHPDKSIFNDLYKTAAKLFFSFNIFLSLAGQAL
ncbi:MAG: hypothetical protein ABIH39_00440 [Candidatus Margulisiibacteriota bacterium]